MRVRVVAGGHTPTRVPPERLVGEKKEVNPDIVGLAAWADGAGVMPSA